MSTPSTAGTKTRSVWVFFALTYFLTWIFFYALPAKYFRSTWISIIIHGSITVLETILILGLVLGLM